MNSYSSFEIRVSKLIDWSPSQAQAFVSAICEVTKHGVSSLQIAATHDGIRFVVAYANDPKLSPEAFSHVVQGQYPTVEVLPYHPPKFEYPFYRRIILMRRTGRPFFERMLPVTAFKTTDPLTVLTQPMATLEAGERMAYVLRLEPLRFSPKEIDGYLTQSAWSAGYRARPLTLLTKPEQLIGYFLGQGIARISLNRKRVLAYSETDTDRYVAKLKERILYTSIRLVMETPHKERVAALTALASACVSLVPSSSVIHVREGLAKTYVIRNDREEKEKSVGFFVDQLEKSDPDFRANHIFYLLPEEVATLWHLPHKDFISQPIVWASVVPKQAVMSPGAQGVVVGKVNGVPVGINQEDRQYHTYITGQTGMGKSALLHNLIHQDIASGHGVGVLDPHGSLIADLLKSSIPTERLDDVVLLHCGDSMYPVPINPFRTPEGVTADATFEMVMWMMKNLYAESWSITRMETTLRYILQLVLADPDATPLDIQKVALNAPYRRRLLATLEKAGQISHATRQFWIQFDDLSPSDQRSSMQPILNRLSAFLGSRHLERMSCHPHALDFRRLMRENKIILINLGGDAIKSSVGSLGAIFFAQFFLASQSLFEAENGHPTPFYLFADEVQRYVTNALPNMFSEARKFGLFLTLANQYIGQLDEETRQGIIKNVGTPISFACAPDEAQQTGKLYEPSVPHEDLSHFSRGQAVMRTRARGETLPAFVLSTFPQPSPHALSLSLTEIVERSRETVGLLPTQEVDTWLDQRYRDNDPLPPQDDGGLHDLD